MQEYKVYEVEAKTTQSGKNLKKLVLQKEGAQYPLKNVTIWEDNPLFEKAVAGETITCEILEKDSGNPNPNAPGKNYINRTVANPNRPATPTTNTNEMGIKTHIDQKFDALKRDLKIIADHLGVEAPQVSTPVPPVVEDAQKIDPEDIPFN